MSCVVCARIFCLRLLAVAIYTYTNFTIHFFVLLFVDVLFDALCCLMIESISLVRSSSAQFVGFCARSPVKQQGHAVQRYDGVA